MTGKVSHFRNGLLLVGMSTASLLLPSSAFAASWPSPWVTGKPLVQEVAPLRPASRLPATGESVVTVPRPSGASPFVQIGQPSSSEASVAEEAAVSSFEPSSEAPSSSSSGASMEMSSSLSSSSDAVSTPLQSSASEELSSQVLSSSTELLSTSEEPSSTSSVELSSSIEMASSAPSSVELSSVEQDSSSEADTSSAEVTPPSSSSSMEPSSPVSSEMSSEGSAQPVASATDTCRQQVAALAQENAILFQPGSATLTAGSFTVLDQLAGDLKLCPDEAVHVEGHTDADGLADANLALSVARAEAVVAALVERGIDQGRLYAEGFGESVPIAPNDIKAGKALNRRIGFRIGND